MAQPFYYNSEENVEKYILMAKPYNGSLLIEEMKKYLPPDSRILELGMGPGKDMDILLQDYQVVGSDLSPVFLEKYKQRNKKAEVLVLDAHNIDIHETFDAIYSNKVLHHLSKKELKESLLRQAGLLNPQGIIMHSFWEGDREDILSGLRFVYYKQKMLISYLKKDFHLISSSIYSEVFPNDSIWILGRKK